MGEGKGSACNEVAKGIPTKEVCMSYKGRSTGKKVEKGRRGEAVHVAKLQEVQQKWRRSSVAELRKRVEEHCGKGVPEKVCLLELG